LNVVKTIIAINIALEPNPKKKGDIGGQRPRGLEKAGKEKAGKAIITGTRQGKTGFNTDRGVRWLQ